MQEKYFCEECKVNYLTMNYFIEPEESVHSYLTVKCQTCNADMKRSLYTSFGYEVAKYKYFCKLCSVTFTAKSSLRGHLKRFHVYEYEKCHQNSCSHCGIDFLDPQKKIEHENRKICSRKSVCCLHCGKSVLGMALLKQHLYNVHNDTKLIKNWIVCFTCGEKVPKFHLRMHKRLMHEDKRERKIYKCRFCDKQLKKKQSLRAHEIMHSGEMKYQCQLCGKQFRTKPLLVIHEAIHTGEAKLFLCDICGKNFQRSTSLANHLKRVHAPKNDSNICEICGKCFPTVTSMKCHRVKAHKIIKIQNRKHACTQCEASYSNPFYLRQHMQRKHNLGAEESAEDRLKRTCKVCGKVFHRERYLVEHMRKHTGETPYWCAQCCKGFKSKNYYNSHVHTKK